MKNKKGFTLIALLIVASIIGLSALIGLRYYTGTGNQQGKTENTVFREKAKDIIVQANAATIQSLLQAALAGGDINRDKAVELAQNAGLQNPYNEVAMNTSDFEVVLLNPTKKVGGKPISLKHLRIKSLREN